MSSQREMPYSYPIKNSDLIKIHKLTPHFEGGFFAQTAALTSLEPDQPTWGAHLPKSDAVQGKGREHRFWGPMATLFDGPEEDDKPQGKEQTLDATIIYYLLTGDDPRGAMHTNVHPHFLCHHAGRSRYTFIKPPSSPSDPPIVKTVVMGPNVDQGELTQLFVPGGWFKASECPEEDVQLIKDGKRTKEDIGALISEVVVPGWVPQQFQFIDEAKLKSLFHGDDEWKKYAKFLPKNQ